MPRLMRLGPEGLSPLGSLEMRVMSVLWAGFPGKMTVGDVEEKLSTGAPSYSATKAVLANLVAKRLVRKIDTGRAKSYAAVTAREDFERQLIGDVIDPIYRTHRNPLLAHLVDELLDDEGIAEIESLITQRRSGKP
jgi:predicted transcriptional regulator